jgi:hypothetical protein
LLTPSRRCGRPETGAAQKRGRVAGVHFGQPASQQGRHSPRQLHPTDNLAKLEAAHHSPEFRKKRLQFGKLADAIDPGLCDVVCSNAADPFSPPPARN